MKAAVAGVLLALIWAAPAAAQGGHLYWANQGGNSIGRAKLDGSAVDQAFITGANTPRAVTVGGTRLFWAQGGAAGRVGRANLDGREVNQSLVATGSNPSGVAVDANGVYWTFVSSGAGRIGRARPDGSSPNPRFGSTGPTPCGLAVDPDKVYWGNGGDPGAIGRSHGPLYVTQAFVTGTRNPCGVAVTNAHLYWANRAGNAVARANVDGSGPEQSFIPAGSPCGVAVDGTHIYWSTAGGTIGRARLDGSEANPSFITGALNPCGVAVDPTVSASTASHSFPVAGVRRNGVIQAFFFTNTSSSTLAVSRVRLLGPHAADFVTTGDSCTVDVTAAGGGCTVNVRFRPRRAGRRNAVLRVSSNASNSPTDVALTGVGDSPPRLRGAVAVPRAFKVGRGHRRGTTFGFSLSERARVRFTVAKKVRARGRVRYRHVGRFSRRGRAGRNRRRFSGKLGRRRLRPGSYRATLVATDAARIASAPRHIRFRVRR